MAFEANEYEIVNLFYQNLLEIPRNQRKYVWTEENWNDLLTDIEFVVANNQETDHFLGSVVLRKEEAVNKTPKYSIIDGQQRTITIIIFLLALIKLFKENDLTADAEGTIQYLFVKDRKSNEYFVLNSEYHLGLRDLAEVITHDDKKTTISKLFSEISLSKKSNKFKEAFTFYYNRLKQKSAEEGPEVLIKIKDSLLDAKYIRINTDSDEDAYTVFEILNARGQTLEDYELIKNYIMRYIFPKEKVDEVKEKWTEIEECLDGQMKTFFRHYLTHSLGYASTKEVYRVIQQAFPKDKVHDLLKDLHKKANLYKLIITPSSDRNPDEFRILTYLKSRKSVQLRPLLLSLMSAYERESITLKEYIDTLQFLQNFFICFTIISSEKSNKLTDVVSKYSKLIETQPSTETLKQFHASLKAKLPTYETFRNTFKELGYSKHYEYFSDSSKKTQVMAALELIENHLCPGYSAKDVTIEHIIPDSWDKNNAYIGNLTLFEKSLNHSCDDKPLAEKLEAYADSSFRMTRRIAKRYQDNPSQFKIDTRAEKLAKLIYKDIFKFDL